MSLLVSIDFSPVTDAQIDIVDRLARPNREIHLLHVTEPDPSFVGLAAGPEEVQHQVASELRRAQAELDALAERLRAKGHAVDTLLVPGPTVQTILEQAQKLDAEVIVMGSHGRGKLFDLVVGSVSAGVIRKSPVPVLVVPARNEA
ncbi:MAG TPA: universal stress protein [Polyangiales bacterium]|nr:universal stress protein [Polyangiales bacterium]